MKCREIVELLEKLAPMEMACSWDNPGLLAGRWEKEVRRIYLALDATEEVIRAAKDWNADMLITHHPLIFSPLKSVTDENFVSRRILELIQSDISYYAMHTNFDVMGMADAAADELSLKDRRVLDVTYEDDISKEGCGRVGELKDSMRVEALAGLVKEKFHVPNVRVFGDLDSPVRTVAVMPGSGGGFIQDALAAGADVMITGDVGHHEGIDAVAQGLAVIDAGHYGIEKLFISYMEEFMKRELPGVQIYKAEIREPFIVV